MTNKRDDDRAAAVESAVAQVLKGEQEIRAVSYDELEAKTGISKSTIGRILRGATPPTLGALMRLSEALGLDFLTVHDMAEDRVRRGL